MPKILYKVRKIGCKGNHFLLKPCGSIAYFQKNAIFVGLNSKGR